MWEWNEALSYETSDYSYRNLRGGYYSNDDKLLRSTYRTYFYPTNEYGTIGFRVSYVPEPSSIIALLGGLTGLIGLRRRQG